MKLEIYHEHTLRLHRSAKPGDGWAVLCQLLFAGYAVVKERENPTTGLTVFIAVKSGAVDVIESSEMEDEDAIEIE